LSRSPYPDIDIYSLNPVGLEMAGGWATELVRFDPIMTTANAEI